MYIESRNVILLTQHNHSRLIVLPDVEVLDLEPPDIDGNSISSRITKYSESHIQQSDTIYNEKSRDQETSTKECIVNEIATEHDTFRSHHIKCCHRISSSHNSNSHPIKFSANRFFFLLQLNQSDLPN